MPYKVLGIFCTFVITSGQVGTMFDLPPTPFFCHSSKTGMKQQPVYGAYVCFNLHELSLNTWKMMCMSSPDVNSTEDLLGRF